MINPQTFSALSEPTRRNILELLANSGQMSATDIYRKFSSTPPAISQHLKVLKDAELVQVEKKAQQRIYTINVQAIQGFETWIKQISAGFNRLDKVLAMEKKKARHH